MFPFFRKADVEPPRRPDYQVQAEDIEWFEVWCETHSSFPFYFLLLAKEKGVERYVIVDIHNQHEIISIFGDHYDAHMFLAEDEFWRVTGRIYEEDF